MHDPSLLIMYSTTLLIDSCAIMHFWLSCPVPPLWQVPVVLTVVCCGSYSFTLGVLGSGGRMSWLKVGCVLILCGPPLRMDMGMGMGIGTRKTPSVSGVCHRIRHLHNAGIKPVWNPPNPFQAHNESMILQVLTLSKQFVSSYCLRNLRLMHFSSWMFASLCRIPT